jgi:sulfur-carrier protein adenylyltransferase/sulfurtransferase
MQKSGRDLIQEARSRIRETSADAVRKRLDAAEDLLILDVREADEVRSGMIPGAAWLPRGFLELKFEGLEPSRDRPVVVYCGGGFRSALAADTLRQMGYETVESLDGGFRAWTLAGFPVQRP